SETLATRSTNALKAAQEEQQPKWAQIILDTEFFPYGNMGGYWEDLERGFQVGAFFHIKDLDPNGGPVCLGIDHPVNRERFSEQFGKPDRVAESGGHAWDYYGPIGFRFETKTNGEEVLLVTAPVEFYKEGFRTRARSALGKMAASSALGSETLAAREAISSQPSKVARTANDKKDITIEMATKDPGRYKGERVTWLGSIFLSEEESADGRPPHFITYGRVDSIADLATGETLFALGKCFTVRWEESVSAGRQGKVKGTISGTYPVRYGAGTWTVPLLIDPEWTTE
ncbi:MAG: hypothetical protein NTW86_16135, partial [Candidatus Sumerlaeota bacterium]|nr:hypothetical protein [Candidatus Sumerlaeota bacterium]